MGIPCRVRIRLKEAASIGRRPPEKVIFVLATHRSGSTYLCTLLDSIDGISMAGEVLNHHTRPWVDRMDDKRSLRYIDRCLRGQWSSLPGAKLLIPHLNRAGIDLEQLVDRFPQAHTVVLYRRDLLGQHLSMERAGRTKAWTSRQPTGSGDSAPSVRDDVDLAELVAFADRTRALYRDMLGGATVAAMHFVAYEDLDRDPGATMDGLLAAVGIPGSLRRDGAPLQKQRLSEPGPESISNWAAVQPLLERGALTLDLSAP